MAKANDLTTEAVNVDYRYAEWLADWLYPAESPLPHLDLRNNEMSTLKQQKNWCVDFADSEEGFQQFKARSFPETEEAGKERVRENVEATKNMVKTQGAKLIAEVTTSHGFFVDQTRVVAFGEELGSLSYYSSCTAYRLGLKADGEVDLNVIHSGKSDYIVTRGPV